MGEKEITIAYHIIQLILLVVLWVVLIKWYLHYKRSKKKKLIKEYMLWKQKKDKNGWPINEKGQSLCTHCLKTIKAVDLASIAKEGMFHHDCWEEFNFDNTDYL